MTDPPPDGTPRWVKIFGIIALVLVLLVGIMLLTGVGGAHGPGRHMQSGAAGATTPSSGAVDRVPFRGGPDGRTPIIEYGVQPS